MTSEKKWFVVYTKPRCEKKLAELLGKMQVDCFAPAAHITRQWTARRKTKLEPVFACYVFLFISEAEQSAISKLDYVIHFVYWLGNPVPVEAEEIDAMRFLIDENGSVVFEQIEVGPIARVKTTRGPFLEWTGHSASTNIRSVKATLPSLGVSVKAEVSMSRQEKVRFINATGLPLIAADSKSAQTNTGS